MSVSRRYRAPTEEGVLSEPPEAEIGNLLLTNRAILDNASIFIDGTPLPAFRLEAIAEVLAAARQYHRDAGEPVPDFPDGPLLMSGHQPELTHVGVLVKTFALNGLARRHGLTPLNLIQDNDTTKNTSMRMPVLSSDALHSGHTSKELSPEAVHLLAFPYDRFEGEVSYETRRINDPELFRSVLDRAMPIARQWGFRPILPEFWAEMSRQSKRTPILGEIVVATRRFWELRWGCHNLEIPLSLLCATNAFQRFARHVLRDLPRFHAIYNECVAEYRDRYGVRSRNHPVPDLYRDGDVLEAPFWSVLGGDVKRARLMMKPGELPSGPNLRSRALTTTMFLRYCLSDGFIHGIGGAKYDEVTDAIVKRWLGLEAPGFIVFTATLRMPLPRFPTTPESLHAAERKVRDLRWNPQRHLSLESLAIPEVNALVTNKERLMLKTPTGKPERKAWFRQLSELTDKLRPFVADQIEAARRDLMRKRIEGHANDLMMRRDYPWCLFPESVVGGFCKKLL